MIQANVRSTQTMVNQRATEIRFKELTLFTDNLGVIASLAAFFAETSLESLYIEPETVSKESATNHFSTLAWILSSVTISLNLLTLLVAIYTMLHGPALARRGVPGRPAPARRRPPPQAIRGPAGSMALAVSRIFVQRKLALRLFWAGLLCKVVQATCLAAWRYPPEAAITVAAVFALFVVATYSTIKRVTSKFSFRQFGLRREDFIEIALPQGGSNLPPDVGGGAGPAGATVVAGGSARPANVTLCGWLMKQSAYLKRWNSRYFTLSASGELSWSSSSAAPPRGYVSLSSGDVQVAPITVASPGVPAFGLTISCRDATAVQELVVATDSNETRAQWSRALQSIVNRRAAAPSTANPVHQNMSIN